MNNIDYIPFKKRWALIRKLEIISNEWKNYGGTKKLEKASDELFDEIGKLYKTIKRYEQKTNTKEQRRTIKTSVPKTVGARGAGAKVKSKGKDGK